MSLRIDGRARPGGATLALQGELDARSTHILTQHVDRAVAAGATVVVLDLAAMSFVDSSGLGAILGRHRMLAASGRRLVLTALPDHCRRLFAITHLDDVLDIREVPEP